MFYAIKEVVDEILQYWRNLSLDICNDKINLFAERLMFFFRWRSNNRKASLRVLLKMENTRKLLTESTPFDYKSNLNVAMLTGFNSSKGIALFYAGFDSLRSSFLVYIHSRFYSFVLVQLPPGASWVW